MNVVVPFKLPLELVSRLETRLKGLSVVFAKAHEEALKKWKWEHTRAAINNEAAALTALGENYKTLVKNPKHLTMANLVRVLIDVGLDAKISDEEFVKKILTSDYSLVRGRPSK